jgi:hypothetical protein
MTKTGAAQLQFIGHQTTTATKEQDKSTPDSTRLEAVVAARCRHEEQEQSGDRRSFMMKPRKRSAGCDEVQQKKILGRKETLISSSVYHVTNGTCMHLRHKGSNIYMYRRGEYIKNPVKKYNNRKD